MHLHAVEGPEVVRYGFPELRYASGGRIGEQSLLVASQFPAHDAGPYRERESRELILAGGEIGQQFLLSRLFPHLRFREIVASERGESLQITRVVPPFGQGNDVAFVEKTRVGVFHRYHAYTQILRERAF